MTRRARWGSFVVLVVALGALPAEARADVLVDRIVAVVGARAITLSELRLRLVPFQKQVDAQKRSAGERAAAYAALNRELLDRMIDEVLLGEAAKAANVVVEREEIDRAIAMIAAQSNVSPAELLSEAERQGMPQAAYRAELGRQILEMKLLQRRFPRQAAASTKEPAALQRERVAWLRALREATYVDVRL